MDTVWSSQNLPHRVTCRELLNACVSSLTTAPIFVPAGVLKNLQMQYFGPAKWIEKETCAKVVPQALLESTNELLKALPPLCASLLLTLENEAQDLKSKDICITVLRDLNLSFDELWKVPTARAQALFVRGGMCKGDAEAIALAVYSKKRRQTTNEVEELSAVERAVRQLAVSDESVSLASCGLDDERLESLYPAIVRDVQLRQLDLSGNNIHRSGCDVVARIVCKLSNLQTLCLSGNNLLRAGCDRVLTECAKLQKLRHLDISGCHGGPKLTQSLVTFLDGNSTLVHLNIASNDLANLDVFPKLPNLRVLDISSNRLRGDDVADLSKALGSPLLATIQIHNNLLDDAAAHQIVQFAAGLKRLRHVGVSFNPLTDVGLTTLSNLYDSGVTMIAANGTLASAEVQQTLLLKHQATLETSQRRLTQIRSVPLSQWLESDVELVSEKCVEDVDTTLSLIGLDGARLSASRSLQFTQTDWTRLSEFQE
jgi:Ran GTPase-activating protein (RanGAP) involved in mRNA processing and transport